LDKIQLVTIPEVLKSRGPGFEIAVPQKDPQELIELLSRQFPEERDGIRNVIEEMTGIVRETDRLVAGQVAFSDFPAAYPRLWNVHNKTLYDFLDGLLGPCRGRRHYAGQGNFVLTKFFLQWRLIDPVWNGSKLHHRPRTIKALHYKNNDLCSLHRATP
jgi:hypothetical protein